MKTHKVVCAVIVLVCWPLSAAAQSNGSPEAVFRDQYQRAAAYPSLTDLVFHWKLEDSYLPPEDALNRLRAAIQKNPADRHSRELVEYERRLAEKTPMTRRYSLRARSSGEWRLCQNDITPPGAFIDYALSDSLAWKLTPTWVVLLDPRKPFPNGHPIRDVGAFFFNDLSMLLDAGLHAANLQQASLESVRSSGDSFTAVIAHPRNEFERHFVFTLDSHNARAVVQRVNIIRGPDAGASWLFHDWTLDPASSLWVARRAEKFSANGSLACVLTLEDVVRDPAERFAQALTPPDFSTPDALRGELKLKSMTDYREEVPMEIIQTSRGIEKIPLAITDAIVDQGEQDYRRLGWGLAGLAAVALVFVRLSRPRGGGASSSPFSLETHA